VTKENVTHVEAGHRDLRERKFSVNHVMIELGRSDQGGECPRKRGAHLEAASSGTACL